MSTDNRSQFIVTEDEFAAFIGVRASRYLSKFRKFSIDGIDRFAATWHWPAFFCGFWWLLYRKMYLWALVYFIMLAIPYANVAAWITLAIGANYLYYSHAKNKINAAKNAQAVGDLLTILPQLGGVNRWVPVVAVFVTMAAFFLFLLGVILSAC